MMGFANRYNMCQMLIAFLMCTSLAGQTQPTEKEKLTEDGVTPSPTSNSTNGSTSNATSSTKVRLNSYFAVQSVILVREVRQSFENLTCGHSVLLLKPILTKPLSFEIAYFCMGLNYPMHGKGMSSSTKTSLEVKSLKYGGVLD